MKTHYLTQDQFAEYTKHTGCQVCKGPFFTRLQAHSIGDTVVPEGTMYFMLSREDSNIWDIAFIVAATTEQQTMHTFEPSWLLGINHFDPNGLVRARINRNDVAVGHKQDDPGMYHSDPTFARRPSRVYATHKSPLNGYFSTHNAVECFSYQWEQVGEMLATNAPIMKLTVIDNHARRPIRSCIFDAGKQSF